MAILYFKVSSDYDEVIRLRQECEKLEAQLKKMDVNKSPASAKALEAQLAAARQQMMGLVTEAAKAGAVMESDFKKKIYDASQTVNDLSEKIIAQRTVVREVQADVKRLGETYRTALKNGPIGAASKKSEYDAARKALDEERAALFGLTQEQANARLSVKKLRDEYSLFKEESGDVKDAIGDITGQMKNWIAGIAGGIGIKEFLGQMIQVRGEFENIETSLRVLLGGDSEKLSDIMSQMKEYALISPLTTKDMASALQMMIGFGIQAEDAITYLKALGDISMGDTVHFNSLALAFSQMSAAGKLMGQDLNQMINAGFNPLQQISEKTGKSIGELKDEMSKGAISAQMVQQAFIDATSEGGKFYGMASEGAKTLNGQISMLQESVDNMFNDMGQASEGVILNSIQAVTKLVENYEKVGKVIAGIIITYGVYRAATIANIVATEGWAAAATKDAVAKGAQTIATKALTVAQSALNSVIKANPYVLLATAIASVATAMWAFHDSAEATLQISNKFGEQASTTITKLNTLTSEVNGLAKGTSLRNKVMNELNGLLEEYGVQAIKEGDSIDSVNEKRKEAIELIKQEAIERDRLNNIDAGQQSYQQKLQDAQSDFLNSLKNARSGNDGAISFLSDNEEIQENAEAISTIIGSVVQENISKIAGKTGEEYEKGLNEIFDTIQDRMRAIGISERTISEVWVGGGLFSQSNIVRDYIEKVQEASEEHDRYTDAVNKAADAEKKAADSSSTYNQRIDMLAKSLQKPNDGVHQLYQNIKNLMSRYSDNTIGFTIRIGGEVPQWMNKKSLPELQKLAKQFSAIGEASKNGAFVNGKYMTQQQLLQRGADYATAAEQKQTEADRKKKELADKKEDSEKKNKNEKAIREQKRAEEQRKKAQETADKDLLALQQKNQDDEIALMQDGTQKRLAEIKNDYAKRIAEIDKQEAEFKKKNKEAGLQGLGADGLTKEQQNALQEAADNAAKERERQTNEVYAAEAQAMRDYLKEYGTFQQQKLAIAEEYAEKIANAQSEGERLSLEKEREQAVANVNLSAIRQDVDWAGVFSEFGTMFQDEIERNLDALRDIMKSEEFKAMRPTDQAVIVEAVDSLREQVTGDLKDVDFKKIGELTIEFQNAQRKMITAQAAEAAAYDNLKKAQADYEQALRNGTAEEQAAAKQRLDMAQTTADSMSAAYKGAVGEFNATGNNLKDATDNAVDAINSISSAISQIKSGSLSGAFEGVKNLSGTLGKSLSNMSGLLGKAGNALSKFSSTLGGATGKIVGAVLGLLDLLKDGFGSIFADLSDLMFGAVNGILDDILSGGIIMKPLKSVVDGVSNILNTITFGGLNSWLGGNDKDVMKTVSRLTESNEYLQESIDRLRERIGDESNTAGQTLDYYLTAKDAEEQWRENQQEIIKNLASAWTNTGYGFMGLGGKGSFNGHAPDSSWSGWDYFSETLKSFGFDVTLRNSEDFWNLTPEQMELLRDNNPKEWQKLFDSDGHKNPLEAVEEYIEHAGELEELTNVLNENLTKISFDSLYDNFIDTLMDMDASAEDFADNMSEYFMRAVLSDKVGEMFKTRLNNWYNDFASAMEDGTLSDNEIEALRNSYNDIVKDAMAERDDLANAIGYTSSDNEQQSASKKGYATASQDSIDELSGRTTAMYESNLRIETAEQQQTVAITELRGSISALTAQASGMYNIADETRTILANSYLELQQIRENTGEIIKPIKQMQADIAEVKRNTARL
jgi:tape measure domain-containing protein